MINTVEHFSLHLLNIRSELSALFDAVGIPD